MATEGIVEVKPAPPIIERYVFGDRNAQQVMGKGLYPTRTFSIEEAKANAALLHLAGRNNMVMFILVPVGGVGEEDHVEDNT